ncbi:MAG TPA: hypothetical protein VFL83_20090 [Anaeromyxobacter sp.]|nr:hypothetical protein [Anaeromyxobacter sp.]
MGVDVKLVAVDVRAYRERFLPAYRAAEAGERFDGLVALLEEARRVAPERRYEPPHASVWDDPEMARRRDEAEAARDRGDPGPWKQLVAAVAEYEKGPPAPSLTRRRIAEAVATLASSDVPRAEKVRLAREIGPRVAEVVCLPWGRVRNPAFNLTRSELAVELKDASDELDGMLVGLGLTGGALEVFPAELAEVMSRADVERFARELARFPRRPAGDALARDDETLRELLDFVRANPDFSLAVTSY